MKYIVSFGEGLMLGIAIMIPTLVIKIVALVALGIVLNTATVFVIVGLVMYLLLIAHQRRKIE